jgi:hypothetical protein
MNKLYFEATTTDRLIAIRDAATLLLNLDAKGLLTPDDCRQIGAIFTLAELLAADVRSDPNPKVVEALT